MFAARFVPTAFEVPSVEETRDVAENIRKRKLDISDSDSSSEEEEEESSSSSSSSSDSDSSSSEGEESDTDQHPVEAPEDEDKMDIDNEDTTVATETSDKHLSILKRFQKSINKLKLKQNQVIEDPQIEEEPKEEKIEELNDLVPLPQPVLPRDEKLSSLSSLNANLDWLTKPIYYQTNLTKPFEEFQPQIDPIIVKNLLRHSSNIKEAFSVQISVIETLLRDWQRNKLSPKFQGDLLVNASTGSGKTLAYLIPVVQALKDRIVPKLRCIILVPTKPLIGQVRSTLFDLSKGIDLNIMTFKSETSIKDEFEKFSLTKPDIVISTPGRLVEHLDNLDLTYLRYLIIDEADRLLNQSFQNWCDLLILKLSRQQQVRRDRWSLKCSKLIFSATLTTNAERLSHLKLEDPRLIVINDHNALVNELYQLPPRIKECYIRFNMGLSDHKPLILLKFLNGYQNKDDTDCVFQFNQNVLIFTKSNESAMRLTRLLNLLSAKFQSNLKIASVNSSLKNQDRQKILKQFENNEIDILVSTDLISRGINLNNIKLVINYDLPLSSREYIHRIGRTARANKFGYAISFIFGSGEWKYMSKSCMFDHSINRNEKLVHKINVVRKLRQDQDQDELEKEPGFELQLEEFEKKIYETCLKELGDEVFHGN